MGFDWVKHRADCSAVDVFKQLENGAHNDVSSANSELCVVRVQPLVGVPFRVHRPKFNAACIQLGYQVPSVGMRVLS
jgi:hypothetical protein